MDEVLKRRLVGALVLLLGALLLAFLLPRPGPAPVQEGLRRVTLDLRAPEAEPLPPTADLSPEVIATAQTPSGPVETPADATQSAPVAVASAAPSPQRPSPVVDAPAPAPPAKSALHIRPDPQLTARPVPSPQLAQSSTPVTPPPVQLKPTDRLSRVPEREDGPFNEPRAPAAVASPENATAPAVKPAVPAATEPSPALPAMSERAAAPAAARWSVQIGSFASLANARQVEARLRAAGLPCVLMPIETPKGLLHRVRIAPLAGEAEAQRVKARAVELGYDSATIRQD